MIRMYGITKQYPNGAVALKDLTLEIGKGEFVFLVGPSGAGKSTFMKLIYRQLLPTEGQVFVGGKNVVKLRHSEVPFLRRQVGVVFQDFKLLSSRTVYENVSFALEVIESGRRETRRKVHEALDLVGLLGKVEVGAMDLSGGEQQRVAIARAIVNRPSVLLADEPTGNLDPDTSWGIMQLLQDINARGTTVAVATHNKSAVDRMRQRVIAIEQGQVARDQAEGVYGYED